MRFIVPLSLACLALAACTTTGAAGSSSAPAADDKFTPTGEIRAQRSSASFDANHVNGPRIHVARRPDGSWAGITDDTAGGGSLPIDVSVYPDRIAGVNLTLHIQRSPTGVVINGNFKDQIVRFEINDQQLLVRTGSKSVTLPRTGPVTFGGEGDVTVTGEAAQANPPWPQIAFAFIGAF